MPAMRGETMYVSFRFSDETLWQVEWLARRKGITATDVIRIAVAEFFEQERAKLPLVQLQPDNNDGYTLSVQGKTISKVSQQTIDHLPDEFKEQLLTGTADVGDALVYLVLAASKNGENLLVNRQAIAENVG